MKKNRLDKRNNASYQLAIVPFDWWQISLIPLALLPLLTFLFYYPSLHYNFQFDDLANITKFFNIRHATFSGLFFSGTRWISYWINTIHYSLGKFDPFTYRFGNVTSHTITGIVLYYFLLLSLSRVKNHLFVSSNAFLIAFTTAALFLLHPVQSQTVSYVIQGQLEGIATLCIMIMSLSLLLFDRAKTMGSKIVFIALLFIVGILSCGTKEITIVSPVLLLLVDWFFIAQGDMQSLKKRLWIYGVLTVLVFSIYIYFLKFAFFSNLVTLKMEARNNIGNVLTDKASDKILPLHFFISQFKVILHYLCMFLWPFNISVEYDWKLVKSFFALDCILPLLALCSIAGCVYFLLKKNVTSIIAFAFLWFIVAIAPRSSFIPSSELLTDYKTYLSSPGIMLLLALALVKLLTLLFSYEKLPPFIITYRHQFRLGVLMICLFCIGFLVYQRNKVWRSGEEFWFNIIQNAPEKARAYNNYAVALSEKGLYKESIPYYEKAIAMDAHYPDPLNNLAVAHSFMGNMDQAIAALQRSINIQPHYPEAYNNLASFLIVKNDLDGAEKALNVALQLRPYYGKAYFNMGKIWLSRNNAEKALECFKNACFKADLDTADGFKICTKVALSMKKFDDAILAGKKLLELEPSAENCFMLATAYQMSNKLEDAKRICLQAAKMKPNDFGLWYNLGELSIQLSKHEEAVTYFKKANQLNPSQPQAPFKIAYCYVQMQKKEEARNQLQSIIDGSIFNEQIKGLARHELTQLGKVVSV